MNIPSPLSKQGFADNMLYIEAKLVEHAESLMCNAAQHLRSILCANDPPIINEDPDQAIPCAVTVYGTWQRRGHMSKIGVVFVMSVVTGEILNFEVKSLVCHMCSKAFHKFKDNENELLKWREKHQKCCQNNHKGSSDSMESAAAVEIFCRSIERRKLKYITYVGDGDSDSFGKVRDALEQKYGERYIVSKEDCIGHVKKRMGAGAAAQHLKRCLAGLTQNQNEAVNGQLWSRCPKTHFCGKRRVTIAVCETVTVSNTGAGSQAKFLENIGIPLGLNTLRGLRQKDKT